ncbi:MAG TPA: hypothetical protein VE242_05385 [Chthoniobacterales bacterium]|nr:hypothetical protein [Chthoniobacterales bacterium]
MPIGLGSNRLTLFWVGERTQKSAGSIDITMEDKPPGEARFWLM